MYSATLARVCDRVVAALSTVTVPESRAAITDLGFVRSVLVVDGGVEVRLRVPAALSSSNVAFAVAADALDALGDADIGPVRVLLDGHRDSETINAGLDGEVGDGLHELRRTFLLRAHTAAMERVLTTAIRQGRLDGEQVLHLILRDVAPGREKLALIRRRMSVGLSTCPNSRVVVDGDGRELSLQDLPMPLRLIATTARLHSLVP